MNTNPNAKVILCYGDSNTWGQSDDKGQVGRYASDVRWTGILQELLGDNYYIVEEGLGGRTTNLDHYNPAKQLRNGLMYLHPCLVSHSPLDLVIIMLGTSDLKIQYQRSASVIADTLRLYIEEVEAETSNAKILLVSPILVDIAAPKFAEYYDGIYDAQSVEQSRQLAKEVKRVADETGVFFFDASTVAKAGLDGLHFDTQSHSALAHALDQDIRRVL